MDTVADTPPPRSRLWWLYGGSLVTVVALAFGSLQTVNALAHNTDTVQASFSASELTSVRVHLSDGSVEVVASDVDEVTVTSSIDNGLHPTEHSTEVVDGVLRIESGCPFLSSFCSVHEQIEVPLDLDLRVEVDDGTITVAGSTAIVDVVSHDGSITLERLGGHVTAVTDDGHIEGIALDATVTEATSHDGSVTVAFATAPSQVRVSSDDGQVEVIVPDDRTTYSVDADTGDGDRVVDIRTDPDSERTLVLHTTDGDAVVRYPTG